ncbi:Uncharacterised protein [Nocardia cyriacigeorgica]|uniref:Uncharacterized protein n=1 Tax=Nocardia cyriacigeorgica TaxID=135487 RepID=A0A4U8W1E3_9NOCA|nr:Uncharacterised protein [Nocardia cyriacigeorgica]
MACGRAPRGWPTSPIGYRQHTPGCGRACGRRKVATATTIWGACSPTSSPRAPNKLFPPLRPWREACAGPRTESSALPIDSVCKISTAPGGCPGRVKIWTREEPATPSGPRAVRQTRDRRLDASRTRPIRPRYRRSRTRRSIPSVRRRAPTGSRPVLPMGPVASRHPADPRSCCLRRTTDNRPGRRGAVPNPNPAQRVVTMRPARPARDTDRRHRHRPPRHHLRPQPGPGPGPRVRRPAAAWPDPRDGTRHRGQRGRPLPPANPGHRVHRPAAGSRAPRDERERRGPSSHPAHPANPGHRVPPETLDDQRTPGRIHGTVPHRDRTRGRVTRPANVIDATVVRVRRSNSWHARWPSGTASR